MLAEGMSVMFGALATPSTVDHHWGLWGGGGGVEAEVLSNKSYIRNTSEKPAIALCNTSSMYSALPGQYQHETL